MNLLNNYLFLFTIFSIILFATLPISSQKIFTYEETQTEDVNRPIIHKIHNYDDNTIVVRIVRVNSSAPNSDEMICLDGFLSLRTIFPNGSVASFDIPLEILDIQYLNFCLLQGSKIENPLKTYSIRSNFLLVTYTVAEDLNNPFTYSEEAMVVDIRNGKIYGLGIKIRFI